jgi:hypothetical protein
VERLATGAIGQSPLYKHTFILLSSFWLLLLLRYSSSLVLVALVVGLLFIIRSERTGKAR